MPFSSIDLLTRVQALEARAKKLYDGAFVTLSLHTFGWCGAIIYLKVHTGFHADPDLALSALEHEFAVIEAQGNALERTLGIQAA